MPRVYTRRFDYEEARRRRAAGESFSSIAAWAGVSESRVRQVVIPEEGARAAAIAAAFRWACPDCGAPTRSKRGRCRRCAALARATTVRPRELQCTNCKEWKPDRDFPHNRDEKIARRGRHTECRPCQTISRRERRHRNPEADRAYQRAYRKRRRARVADR